MKFSSLKAKENGHKHCTVVHKVFSHGVADYQFQYQYTCMYTGIEQFREWLADKWSQVFTVGM